MNILRTCRERDVPSSHAHPHMSHAPHHSHGSTPSSGSRSKAPSLDRQITVQDVECLREAFALFDPDKKETLSHEKLGKVKFKLKILIFGCESSPISPNVRSSVSQSVSQLVR